MKTATFISQSTRPASIPVYWPVYPDNHVPVDENLFNSGAIVQAVEQVPPDEHVFNFDANDQFAERVRILES